MRFIDISAALCEKINVSDAISCDQEKVTKHLAPLGVSMKFLHLQKSLEDNKLALPIFLFNSSRSDLNLIKSCLSILNNEKNLEPRVIKKTNQFISLKFGNVQMLVILNFTITLDLLLKVYETPETKGFFPYE